MSCRLGAVVSSGNAVMAMAMAAQLTQSSDVSVGDSKSPQPVHRTQGAGMFVLLAACRRGTQGGEESWRRRVRQSRGHKRGAAGGQSCWCTRQYSSCLPSSIDSSSLNQHVQRSPVRRRPVSPPFNLDSSRSGPCKGPPWRREENKGGR
jgi:hypothetical protein